MRHAAKLRLRIFEVGYRTARITAEIANVIVRWIDWSLVASQHGLCIVIEWRDYGLISFRVAPKQTIGRQRLKIQTIDERTIAFRRRTCAGQENVFARLNDRAASAATATETAAAAKPSGAAVTPNHRRPRIFISSVLPAVPKFARRRAWLEDPRADMTRCAISFTQERDALFRKRNTCIAPLCLGDLGRCAAEWRAYTQNLIAKRDLIFQIATIERFNPKHGRRLILSPMNSARTGLHAGERNAFARRNVSDLFRELSAARPDFYVLRKSVHRNQVRERPLDFRDQ